MSLKEVLKLTSKFCHLSFKDRKTIEFELNNNNSISNIALLLNKNYSTIRREIKNRKITFERNEYSAYATTCAKRTTCSKKINCSINESCFVKINCNRLNKSPYVCNGCKSRSGCRKERSTYFAKDAHDNYIIKFSESRKGIDLSLIEIEKINKVITPLIKDKNQTINHIFVNHSDLLNFSKQSFYNYIDYSIFAFRNGDLPRKVRYKVRKNSKKRRTKAESAIRQERTYDDFLHYTELNPYCNIVEMDTVEGIKGGKVFLTLLWRKSNFMLIFILDKQTMQCVEDVFVFLQKTIPLDTYRKLFEVILTDNGSEFFNPLCIEIIHNTGEKVTNLFYCDPGCSFQKGALEKNHEFIRYILPKKTSFNNLTQKDCDTISNHINSLIRVSLNNKSSFEAQLFLVDESVLNTLNMYYIKPDDVTLNNSIIKK